jgi:hypothetical protein
MPIKVKGDEVPQGLLRMTLGGGTKRKSAYPSEHAE